MPKALTILFTILTLTTYGQVDNEQIFTHSDYPPAKYLVKADTFKFNEYSIALTQAKLRDNTTYDSTAAFCRIWLSVKKGDTVIDNLFINDCEAVGGCSGIYVSDEQTRNDYFILSKFGDYDGRILIIDTSGKIKSCIGGSYYLSADNTYLFSPYNSDLSGLTVYDLSKNQVLFSADTIRPYLADFYYLNNTYFAVVSNDVKQLNQTEIATFNFETNTLILSTVADAYIEKAKPLKGYNMFTYAPCACGRTK